MALRLFLLFTLVPLLELWLLLRIGQSIGVAPTISLVVVTGLVGTLLAKREGLRVIRSWRQSVSQGRLPEEGIIGGALVLVGGVLLVTPGVVTDVFGLILLLPPTRRRVAALVRRRLERKIREGAIRVVSYRGGPRAADDVIDAEFRRPPEGPERLP